jgi:hypothetical protein
MSLRLPTLVNFDDLRWPETLKMHETFDVRDVLKMRYLRKFPVDLQRHMRDVLQAEDSNERFKKIN